MLAFGASRRACRPTAICTGHLTGNYTRPASREACRRAAVTPQPSRFPSSTPAPHGRGVGCRGTPPAASREACRRAAVKSRPTFMSPYAPARLWRAVRGAGIQSLRGVPKKKRATVPGPVWLPMVVPMLLISTLPFRWGKRASTSAATALASSMQADSLM